MQTSALRVNRRVGKGSKKAQALRDQGLLPGIIYGHGEEPVAVSMNRHDLEVELLHGHRLLTAQLDGKSETFLIKDIQFNHLGSLPLHIDLMRVDLNERIHVKVGIVLKGIPKGTNEGGVLDQQLSEIEIECLASSIPDDLRVNVADLGVGQTIFVKDLPLPSGVKAMKDPDVIVASVRLVAEEVMPAEGAEPGPIEPEVIAKGKIEEEEGEAAK